MKLTIVGMALVAAAACGKSADQEFLDAAPEAAAFTLANEDGSDAPATALQEAAAAAPPLFRGPTRGEIARVNGVIATVVGLVEAGIKGHGPSARNSAKQVWTFGTTQGIALRFTIEKLAEGQFNWIVEAKRTGDGDGAYQEVLRAQLQRDKTIAQPGRGTGILGIDLDAYAAVAAGTGAASTAAGKILLGFRHGPAGSHHRYLLQDFAPDPTQAPAISRYLDVVHAPASASAPGRAWTLGAGTAQLDAVLAAIGAPAGGPGGPEKFHARLRQLNGIGGWSSGVAFGGRFPAGVAALARECWDGSGAVTYRRVWACSYPSDAARHGALELGSGCTLASGGINVGGDPANDTTNGPDDDSNFVPLQAICLAGATAASRADLVASLSSEASADLRRDANLNADDVSLVRGSSSAGFQQGLAGRIGSPQGGPPPPDWPLPTQSCPACYRFPARPRLAITAQNEQHVLGQVQPGQIVDPLNKICGKNPACAPGVDAGGLADEHSTIFPPGTFSSHQGDYVLFGNDMVFVSGGPDGSGAWTFSLPGDYGHYSGGFGPIFHQPMDSSHSTAQCPASAGDATFDLNYAIPGSIVIDPTVAANKNGDPALLMAYEGTNVCMPASAKTDAYISFAIATSNDGGRSWPMYRSVALTNPLPGPFLSAGADGPNAGLGAWGADVCAGNDCGSTHSQLYGRYAVIDAPITLPDLLDGKAVGGQHTLGGQEPAAFVDQVHAEHRTYLYVVGTGSGSFGSLVYPGFGPGLSVARAPLNKGTATLAFTKWYDPDGNGSGFAQTYRLPCASGACSGGTSCSPGAPGCLSNAGLGDSGGGLESPIFSVDQAGTQSSPGYQQCLTGLQKQEGPQISYLEDSDVYLLTFVCVSPVDPLTGDPAYTGTKGKSAAWFFSTLDASQYDLGQQDQWSAPQEIDGSQGPVDAQTSCTAGNDTVFDGWYPTFMSEHRPTGTLDRTGYVFYMHGAYGCEPRFYSTRQFTVTPAPGRCSNPVLCCIQAGGTMSGGHCIPQDASIGPGAGDY